MNAEEPARRKRRGAATRLAAAALFAAVLLPAPARAVLGENLESLRERFGRPAPQEKPQRNVAIWFIETVEDERLVYTVTFGADGRSIAEGLKPVGRAVLRERMVREFIEEQLEPHRGAKTTRQVKPGEKYTFARQVFTCGANEEVFVDEENDFLIISIRGATPSLIAVRAAMLRPAE